MLSRNQREGTYQWRHRKEKRKRTITRKKFNEWWIKMRNKRVKF